MSPHRNGADRAWIAFFVESGTRPCVRLAGLTWRSIPDDNCNKKKRAGPASPSAQRVGWSRKGNAMLVQVGFQSRRCPEGVFLHRSILRNANNLPHLANVIHLKEINVKPTIAYFAQVLADGGCHSFASFWDIALRRSCRFRGLSS